jgi:N-methylhydantoinase B
MAIAAGWVGVHLNLARPGFGTMDSITVQILRNKISSLTDEMHYHFYRSGYSTIIRESRDFSCVILDRSGRLIVAPPMFFHAPVYRHLVGNILQTDGASIAEGDVFVSNHPYEGGLPHVSDMAFVAPVFDGDDIVAFAGSIAHKADIGGAVAGSTSANATEMYHEGLLIPPIRIWKAGEFQPDIERIVLANSRQPELVRGDMNAQIAVTQMGAARVKELCRRFGTETVTGAIAAILDSAAEELRRVIRTLPEGIASAEGFLDSDGVETDKPVKLAVTISIKDGVATFDFSDSGPQARGPINLRPSMVEACVFYALIGCLDPKLQFNDGMRDAARIVLAPRTVTNAAPPAPVSNYQMVNLKLVDVILEALAHFHPARGIASSGSSSALSIAWRKARPGASTMQYEIIGSSYGGGHGHDGCAGTATHLSNLHITPIEILESEYPCRISRFDLVPDSGGAGRWRGGLSLLREYELLEDATVVRRFDKVKFPPRGLAGGTDGAGARFTIGLGTSDERDIAASGRYEMKAGARFRLQTAGGGGYGMPSERAAEAIEGDIGEGCITREGAVHDYRSTKAAGSS